MNGSPDFIYGGTSRCGSTWMHDALGEHPAIAVPEEDPVNFFDVRYHRGFDWYREVLPDPADGVLVGDTSPGYMKSIHAPERIAEAVPDVKIVFSVRNPIDRAFSDWWHEKSFGNLNWDFEGCLHHHPAYDMLVAPGFYDAHIERFEQHFDDDQIKVVFFDDFKEDNLAYIRGIYSFLGVDDGFEPSLVGERVNEASHGPVALNRAKSWAYHNLPDGVLDVLRTAYGPIERVVEGDSAYKRGVDPAVREQLERVYAEDVRALEARTGRDLSHWIPSVDRTEPTMVEGVSD